MTRTRGQMPCEADPKGLCPEASKTRAGHKHEHEEGSLP